MRSVTLSFKIYALLYEAAKLHRICCNAFFARKRRLRATRELFLEGKRGAGSKSMIFLDILDNKEEHYEHHYIGVGGHETTIRKKTYIGLMLSIIKFSKKLYTAR